MTDKDGKFSITKLFGKYDIKYEKATADAVMETDVEVGAGKTVTRSVTLISNVEGSRGIVN
jgi:hypothetical protein